MLGDPTPTWPPPLQLNPRRTSAAPTLLAVLGTSASRRSTNLGCLEDFVRIRTTVTLNAEGSSGS